MDGEDIRTGGEAGAQAPNPDAELGPQANSRAQPMFWVAFLYLAILAALLPHGGSDEPVTEMPLYHPAMTYLLFGCWAAIIAEGIAGFLAAPDRPKPAWKRLLLVVLIPPFRMAVSPRRPNEWVWVPVCGWMPVGAATVSDMEHRTAIPMLIATALIIPVLVAEFGFAEVVDASPALQISMLVLMAMIWFSFALEFVVMVSLAPKKLPYCKKHWINIVIIVLPLFAFLRSLQIFRFLRFAKAGKMVRVYRLRGLITRIVKIALAFNLIERIMSLNPEKYAAQLEEKIAEKEEELAELRTRLAQTQEKVAARAAERAASEEQR